MTASGYSKLSQYPDPPSAPSPPFPSAAPPPTAASAQAAPPAAEKPAAPPPDYFSDLYAGPVPAAAPEGAEMGRVEAAREFVMGQPWWGPAFGETREWGKFWGGEGRYSTPHYSWVGNRVAVNLNYFRCNYLIVTLAISSLFLLTSIFSHLLLFIPLGALMSVRPKASSSFLGSLRFFLTAVLLFSMLMGFGFVLMFPFGLSFAVIMTHAALRGVSSEVYEADDAQEAAAAQARCRNCGSCTACGSIRAEESVEAV